MAELKEKKITPKKWFCKAYFQMSFLRKNNLLFNLAGIFRITAFDLMIKGKTNMGLTQGWEPLKT